MPKATRVVGVGGDARGVSLVAVKSRHYCTVTGDDLSLQTATGDNLTRGVIAQLRGLLQKPLMQGTLGE
eukprot:scaffold28965_cov65-Phaeocystis_antarctica.AAC.7